MRMIAGAAPCRLTSAAKPEAKATGSSMRAVRFCSSAYCVTLPPSKSRTSNSGMPRDSDTMPTVPSGCSA
jgi:hypothetical protein